MLTVARAVLSLGWVTGLGADASGIQAVRCEQRHGVTIVRGVADEEAATVGVGEHGAVLRDAPVREEGAAKLSCLIQNSSF